MSFFGNIFSLFLWIDCILKDNFVPFDVKPGFVDCGQPKSSSTSC